MYEKLQKESQEISEANLTGVLAKSSVEVKIEKNIAVHDEEIKTNDTISEEEQKAEEFNKLCGQIDEIFSRDESLFNHVINHLKVTKVRSFFEYCTKVNESFAWRFGLISAI